MRSALLAVGILLAILSPAMAGGHRAATVTYTPPAEPGDIFTVIDYPTSGGTAESFQVGEVMGNRHRQLTVGSPYASCAGTTPAGAVVRFRHFTADSVPLTLTTTGRIVRGPYQGGMPVEALHRCYQVVS